MGEPDRLRVLVMQSPGPRQITQAEVVLPQGACVRDALAAAGLQDVLSAGVPVGGNAASQLSVWGRKTSPDALLRDGDRLEVCRPLQVDPKVARRTRFQKQGARAAGLFAKKRAGAKAGY